MYVAELISGVTTRSIGVDASGQLVLGRNVIVLPSYSINSIVLASADPRLLFPGSPVFLGAQLPFRPLHKAGFLIDAVQPKAASSGWSTVLGQRERRRRSRPLHRGRRPLKQRQPTERAHPIEVLAGGSQELHS